MIRRLAFLLLIIGGWGASVAAQTFDTVVVTLENPYNTVLSHLFYLQEESYRPEIAAQTLYDVADSTQASRLAIKLKQIFDGEGLYVQVRTIPQDADFRQDTLSGKDYYTLFPEQLPEVYLEKIDGRWYYSSETVAAIPSLHKKVYPFGADLLLNLLPQFGHSKVLGLAMWQYLGLLILLAVGLLLYVIMSKILNPIIKRLSRSKLYPSLIGTDLARKIARMLSLLLLLRFFRIMLPPLQLPIESAQFAIIVIKLLGILFVVMLLINLLTIFITYGERYTKKTESKLDEQLVPIIKRTLQAVIIGIGIIQGLRVMAIDVTALIAGISIGGLALALAAQDMLKNLFGSLTIFLDRPFQIGDWVNFAGIDGTVEEVGFRSTRVRTFANSMIYVPNGKLADMVIDNYGLRNYRRFKMTISLTYDTPPVLIEKFVEGLRELVKNHPKTRKDYYEIHFNDMGSHSLDILFYIFFAAPSWTEELEGKQDILLSILKLGETLGVRFAFPTSTLFVEELPGGGSTSPKYETNSDVIDKKIEDFIKNIKR